MKHHHAHFLTLFFRGAWGRATEKTATAGFLSYSVYRVFDYLFFVVVFLMNSAEVINKVEIFGDRPILWFNCFWLQPWG